MQDWTKVVTEPLGLGGFALFLVFGVLSRLKGTDERRWLAPLAMGMAFLALAGGLTLAYLKTAHDASAAPVVTPVPQNPAPAAQVNQVEQTTTGKGSPAVQGVQGDVTINVDQSAGTWKDKPQPPHKKTAGKPLP